MKNILQNKIEQINKNTNLLKNILPPVKRKDITWIILYYLSQNELSQIAEMHNQSRDELDWFAKIRKIKNYEEMSKEELIISFLKSK